MGTYPRNSKPNIPVYIAALLWIMLCAVIYSVIPVTLLYFGKDVSYKTNDNIVKQLNSNGGNYFEFIVFGDNRAGLVFCDSAILKIIKNINREDRFKKIPIDFVFVLGDVVFRGSPWDYRIYNKIRSIIKCPVISVIGDHEGDEEGGLSDYKKFIGSPEFAFHNRSSYFIGIDNSNGDINEGQFLRLENNLKDSLSYKHRFIFMHKGPISPYQQSWYRPEPSSWSYRFMKMCEKYKVDIVFTGHEHMFKEAAYGGVKYITSGGGGVLTRIPDYDGGFLHYIVVRVYADYVDYEVRKIFPPLWEYLAYYLWKEVFYLSKDIAF